MLKRAFSKINKVAGSSLFRQRALPVALLNAQKCANFSTFAKYNHKIQSIHSFSRRGFASLPEHTTLSMPALSPTMEQGNIVKWHVQVGAKVEPGFQICDVETDKATMAFEVQDSGYIAAILIPEGSKGVQVGKPVAILVEEEADVKAFANYKGEESGEKAAPKQQEQKQPEQKEQKEEKKAAPKPKKAAKAPSKKLPDHSKVAMPALSPTMESGKITQWQKKEGDKIEAGDVIANVETDKATIDFVYQDDGYLAKILVKEGQGSIKVGDIVAIVVDEQADAKAFQDYAGEESQGEAEEAEAEAEPEQESKPAKQEKAAPSEQAAQRASGERVIASPLAKKTAQEQNVDLSQVEGSGPGGRVLKHNVDEFSQKGGAKAKPAEAKKEAPKEAAAKPQPKAQAAPTFAEGQNPYTDIPLTSVREIIAKRLLQSKTTIPHYYLETEIVMDEAIKIRNVLNESAKSKISFNDMFVKAAAHACVEVPEVNSQWQGSSIRRFKNADISVAVDTGSGLITPIVFSANTKGLNEISANTKELIDKAKKNSLKPQEFQGGTFSISNLGMMGISNFAAVINPPQSAILAIAKTDAKVILVDGAPKTVNVMNVTLSCDHRVIDGAVGAKWLEAFKRYLEKPLTLLL